MLLAIAFLMFAALVAAWLVGPDGDRVAETLPVEKRAPESGTSPVTA